MKDIKLAYQYARDIIKGRWLKAEPFLAKDTGYKNYAYLYAKNIIKGRFPEAEKNILNSIHKRNYLDMIKMNKIKFIVSSYSLKEYIRSGYDKLFEKFERRGLDVSNVPEQDKKAFALYWINRLLHKEDLPTYNPHDINIEKYKKAIILISKIDSSI
jgi:hypothetical protein